MMDWEITRKIRTNDGRLSGCAMMGDADRSISTAFGMLDAGTSEQQSLPLTIRAVFIINPENKLMLSLVCATLDEQNQLGLLLFFILY